MKYRYLILSILLFLCSGSTVYAYVISEDTVWTDDIIILEESVLVEPGVTLSIEEGTIVKFSQGTSLMVFGSLEVAGTPEQNVIFTSLEHDIGGDSNSDGSLTQPTPYDGWGVFVVGQYGPSTLMLNHSQFIYGSGLLVVNAPTEIIGSSFLHTAQGVFLQNTLASIKETLFTDPGTYALELSNAEVSLDHTQIDGALGEALSVFESVINIQNSSIKNTGGYAALSLYSSEAVVKDTIFDGGIENGIQMFEYIPGKPSSLKLNTSIVQKFFGEGIGVFDSVLEAEKVVFEENRSGISLYRSSAHIHDVIAKFNIVGIEAYNTYDVSISESSITENLTGVDAYNLSNALDARNNWWGDSSGPYHELENPQGLGDSIGIFGDVIFSPWKTVPPGIVIPSVAFIPGFQAVRLFDTSVFDSEERVWEPEHNGDLPNLYLNELGESVRDIKVGEAIDAVKASIFDIPLSSVYGSFFEFLDEQVSEGVIASWDTLPYDWRMRQDVVAAQPIERIGDQLYTMVNRIDELAQQSPSGTVTLIAHSNGGIIGKFLIDELKHQGKDSLIDQFIIIASPQVGTPKAIASLLHGEDQEKLGGLLVKKSTARILGRNMPGAYGLLPGEAYFDRVSDPVITFDTSSSTSLFRNYYGESIDSYKELEDFLLGKEGRVEETTTQKPIILNEYLFEKNKGMQDTLTHWVAPEHIKVIQIVGWGLNTIKGIEYYEREKMKCSLGFINCRKENTLDYRPLVTVEGDETVVYPSANYLEAETYYFDLKQQALESIDREHFNITESENFQKFLKDRFQGSTENLPSYFYIEKPEIKQNDIHYLLGIYSPITIGMTDIHGNYTGLIGNTVNSDSDEIRYYKEEIPGSSYFEFGEGKYILVPKEGEYTVILEGYDEGTATLEISEVLNDKVISTTSFEHFPVYKGSQGTLVVDQDNPVLIYDINGDGASDMEYVPGEILKERITLQMIVEVIQASDFPLKLKKILIQILELVERFLSRFNNNALVNKFIDDLVYTIEKEVRKSSKNRNKKDKINSETAEHIIDLIHQYSRQQ